MEIKTQVKKDPEDEHQDDNDEDFEGGSKIELILQK